MSRTTFSQACADPNLLGPWFRGPSWSTWGVLDRALFGDWLSPPDAAIFADLTGGREPPTVPVSEAWIICGRRAGKSVKAAGIAVYLATIHASQSGILDRLVPGERAVVQVMAVNRDQARVVFRYVSAMLEQPLLKTLVVKADDMFIELSNRVAVEVVTSDQRKVRGRTVLAAVFDEVAFWRGETSVSPDVDVYAAVKPAMSTVNGAMLIGISSPYARKGLLWEKYKRHYGQSGSTLVVQAPTWTLNPTLPRDGEFLTQAFEDDPASASAEYGAEFRKDIEAFVSREVVEACTDPDIIERSYKRGIQYKAFVDPSGGIADSFTLAIAHNDNGMAVLDVVRERKPPFSPKDVVSEYARLLRSFGILRVKGDRYAGEWPREAFREHGVTYETADKTRSELYVDLLPALNSNSARLLDIPALANQLVGLERKTGRGREIIDHGPNGHDDVANAVAGALDLVSTRYSTYSLQNAIR